MASENSATKRHILNINRNPSRSVSPTKDKRRSIVIPSYAHFPTPPQNGLSTPAREPSPDHDTQSSDEPDILTALAAQERLVLELKESLQKAEEHLSHLRKQWATHESLKRRNERHRLHQMKSMHTSPAKPVDPDDDPDGSSAWMYEEMERRKALLGNAKSTHRRVFSGSRETKTLSLLSPSKMAELSETSDDNRRPRDPIKPPLSPTPQHHQQTPWQGNEFPPPGNPDRNASRSPQREALLQTGKQMATDLRDGLWTFLEDLRHAAVGDDARTPGTPTKPASRQSSPAHTSRGRRLAPSKGQSPDRTSAADQQEQENEGDTFWKDQGLAEPIPLAAPLTPKRLPRPRATSQLDPHSPTTHTPSPASTTFPSTKRSSATFSLGSLDADTVSVASSTDAPNTTTTTAKPTSDSNNNNKTNATPPKPQKPREAIPWPELTKLAPGSLRRTASELMAELERGLTPSPNAGSEDGKGGKGDGGFFGGHEVLLR